MIYFREMFKAVYNLSRACKSFQLHFYYYQRFLWAVSRLGAFKLDVCRNKQAALFAHQFLFSPIKGFRRNIYIKIHRSTWQGTEFAILAGHLGPAIKHHLRRWKIYFFSVFLFEVADKSVYNLFFLKHRSILISWSVEIRVLPRKQPKCCGRLSRQLSHSRT